MLESDDNEAQRNSLTDFYYRVFKWEDRCRTLVKKKTNPILMVNLPILQKRVNELIDQLVDLGLVFETPYELRTENQ